MASPPAQHKQLKTKTLKVKTKVKPAPYPQVGHFQQQGKITSCSCSFNVRWVLLMSVAAPAWSIMYIDWTSCVSTGALPDLNPTKHPSLMLWATLSNYIINNVLYYILKPELEHIVHQPSIWCSPLQFCLISFLKVLLLPKYTVPWKHL